MQRAHERSYSCQFDSFVDKIRLAQIIARMNEQQFYREAGARRRRITINRISSLVHPSARPVVRLSGSAASTARSAAAACSVAAFIPHRPLSALTSRPLADKNHRRIGPHRKDAKPVIDTVIIEYLYRAPIFVHYGRAGPALSARCRRSHEPVGAVDGPTVLSSSDALLRAWSACSIVPNWISTIISGPDSLYVRSRWWRPLAVARTPPTA